MLFPYLPSLLVWGHSDVDIKEFVDELAASCGAMRLVQVHLTGEADAAVLRAATREGSDWLDRLVGKVGRYDELASPVTDLPSLVLYMDEAQRRTAVLLREVPWPVMTIDADRGPANAADEALAFVTTCLEADP